MSTLPLSTTGLSEPSGRTIRSWWLGRSKTGFSGARASTVDTRAASPNQGLSTPGGTPPSRMTAVRSSRRSVAGGDERAVVACSSGAARAGVLTAADATSASAAPTATSSSRRAGAASRRRATGSPEKLGAGVLRSAAATTRVRTRAASAP